jgi:predicted nucleotide-binding protein (sugar kinase/HSP70/actin superfamily)
VTEWIYYIDYVRKHELQKRLKLYPWWKRPFTPEFRELIVWRIEALWKKNVEHKVEKALKPTKLLPSKPHNMEEILRNAYGNFVTSELESEISISSGVASTAMLKDYSGIINISPFACLIGRVIEGIVNPWAREHRYPMLSVEIDGEILPPSTINRLEIFMLNVLRFRQSPDAQDLVEQAEKVDSSLDRKIIRE